MQRRARIGVVGKSMTLALAVAVIASACRDSLGPTADNAAARVTLAEPAKGGLSSVHDGEQLFRNLAVVATSSAGFYYDEHGSLIVRVRDSKDDAASISYLRELLQKNVGLNPGAGRFARGIRIERAQYTYSELAGLRDRLSDNLLGTIAGVSMIDLDERANRVAVISSEDVPTAAADARRTMALLSVNEKMVELRTRRGLPFKPDFAPPSTLQGATTDPLAGGLQIVRNVTSACTLGFVAQRNGVLGFVTASHCTSNFLGGDNTQYTQTGSSTVIGQESVDPAPYPCSYPLVYQCRGSDASFFASSLQHPMTVGKILRTTGYGSLTINASKPYFTAISYQDDVILGQIVDKVGRTTGWTSGYVSNTCIDLVVFQNGVAHQIRCSVEGTYPADNGDSGAPVFVRLPGHPEIQGSELPGAPFWTDEFVSLVGTHSGRAFGEKYFSKLGRIKSDMGGSWTVTAPVPPPPPAPLSVYVTGPVDVLTSPNCNLRYVANATGGVWNTYSYTFTTSGTVKYVSGREIIVAFSTNGTHHISVAVTDANNTTVNHSLQLIAGPSGMDCNNI